MSTRDSIAEDLERLGWTVQGVGDHGLVVSRQLQPQARVFCVDNDTEPFTANDLRQAMSELEGLQFVVARRRLMAPETYTAADEQGVGVGGFRDLKLALLSENDVGRYRSVGSAFVEARLDGDSQIESWCRRDDGVYEITLTGFDRGPVTIATFQGYEMTSDALYKLIARYDDHAIDAFVSTNPNVRGFAPSAQAAAGRYGGRIMTFADFLDRIRHLWG